MRPDGIVIRHNEYNAIICANRVDCPSLTRGIHTVSTHTGLIGRPNHASFGKLDGLVVSIVGDIAHSRVANSNMILLSKMGAHVKLIAPAVLMPKETLFQISLALII